MAGAAAQGFKAFSAIIGLVGAGVTSRGCAPDSRPPNAKPPSIGFGVNSTPDLGNNGANFQRSAQNHRPVQEHVPIQNHPPVPERNPILNLPPSSYIEGYRPPPSSIGQNVETYRPSNLPPSSYYEGYQPAENPALMAFLRKNDNSGNNNNSGYDHHNWNKVGPSGKYQIHTDMSGSRKEAYDRAQRAGHGHKPIEHNGHFHATDAYGNKIPGSHYAWGGKR